MNKIHVTLAATLAACFVAFADTTDPTVKVQTFEGLENTQGIWVPGEGSGWTTTPAVATNPEPEDYPAILTAGSPSAAPSVNGYGVVDAAHTKVLSLNGGTATVEMPKSSSGIITSDLLVKVVRSSLDTLSVEGFTDPKLAIAVDKDGKFRAWTDATTGFSLLSDTVYPEDTWVRVTTLISNDCCRIALNGQLACNGAWLSLSSATAPTNLTVQSSSCIDDVVVKPEASGYVYDKYAAVNNDGSNAVLGSNPNIVPINYLLANNMETNSSEVVTADVKLTYDQGVATNATFAISSGSFDGSYVTLTFPGDWPADAYVVKYGSSPDKLNSTATMSSSEKSGGNNTVVVGGNMSERTVLYYQVARTP